MINSETEHYTSAPFQGSSAPDTLSGLSNRIDTINAVESKLDAQGNTAAIFALLSIDNLRRVNNELGHKSGDMLVRAFGQSLINVFGSVAIVGRVDGNRFLVFCPSSSVLESQKMLEDFVTDNHLDPAVSPIGVQVKCSCGFTVYPDQSRDFDELYTQAESALRVARQTGITGVTQYDRSMDEEDTQIAGFAMSDITNCIPAAMLVYKANDSEEILFANRELLDLFGCLTFAEFMDHTGGSFRTLVHPDDIYRVEKEIWSQIPTSDNIDFCTYRIIAKDGVVKNVEDYGKLVHSKKFGTVFYVAIHDLDVRAELVASNR